MRITLLICASLVLAVVTPTAADALPELNLAGTEERVFDWDRDRCANWDIPDTPARAWRTAEREVALVSGAEATRAWRGRNLDALVRSCDVLHRGQGDNDPAAWDDRTWIAAVYTEDGKHMIALAHMEYHGHLRPEHCPSADYAACWFNAVIELRSEDGGRTFRRTGGGADLVAALPVPYRGEAAHRLGFFNPSNILRSNDNIYAFVFAESAGPQRRGPCLIRRHVAGGPGDWRAWDGTDFSIRFADPYREKDLEPAAHACRPVSGLRSTVSSVVRDSGSGFYVAVTAMRNDRGKTGIFWSTSSDLLNWSQPRLLYEVPLLWHRDCDAPAAYAYPSLIDPDSPSPVFDTTDDSLWLYLTRMPLDSDCAVTPQRDLVRLRIRVSEGGAPP